jgi:hypothetical protein
MRYTGKLFHPPGAKLHLDLAGLSPIQGKLAFDVFAQLKSRMEKDQFALEVDPAPTYPATTLAFQRFGQTAGVVTFLPEGVRPDGSVVRLDAALAILPRLDRADDTGALASLLSNPLLGAISPDDFESAHQHPGPLTAAFFTSEEALNAPLLHGLMSLAGAAFFDRLGLLA